MEDDNKVDMAEVVAWANEAIEQHREEFERMSGYTPEMKRRDNLAKGLQEKRRNDRPC